MATLNIPKEELPQLQAIAALEQNKFQAFLTALKETPPTVTVGAFADHLSEKSDVFSDRDLRGVLKTLVALYWMKDRSGFPAKEVAEDISEAVFEKYAEGFPNGEDDLTARLEALLSLDRSLGVSAKALDVLTEHERVFCGARVLSDVRPVFVGDGTQTPAAMIVHQLQISFHQDGKHKELYFALDTDDIEEIMEVIERAQRKTTALEKIISDAKMTYLNV